MSPVLLEARLFGFRLEIKCVCRVTLSSVNLFGMRLPSDRVFGEFVWDASAERQSLR